MDFTVWIIVFINLFICFIALVYYKYKDIEKNDDKDTNKDE